jgi:uncharacterized metal-binding protein
MPSGKIHMASTKKLAVPYGVASFFILLKITTYIISFGLSVVGVIGFLCGIYLTPDLDHIEATITSKMSGDPIKKYWGVRWYLYGYYIPHRSFISHFPIISTIIRIVYFSPEIFIAITLLSYIAPIPDLIYIVTSWIVGLCFADILHIAMDVLHSKFKR